MVSLSDVTVLPELPKEYSFDLQNYVRKLGFEEAPDYGFLRDLFLKVLKNMGESDDRVFDWCLLNNGKGWEYGSVSYFLLFIRTPSK